MSDATKYLMGRIKQGDEVNALKATIKEQAAEIERLRNELNAIPPIEGVKS